MRLVLPALAFATLAAFLLVLLLRLPRADLICLVALTLALAGWDIVQGWRGPRD